MAVRPSLGSSRSSKASSSTTSTVGFMARRQYNHFHFHGKDDPAQAAEEAKCHYCQLEAFSTHKEFAISIVFTPGETRMIPKGFQFIEDVMLTPGVQLAESNFLSGCKCVDEYHCMIEGCECMGNLAIDGDKINAYHAAGDRKGCLRGHMLNSRLPIYECNDRCACGVKCANRVVTAGRKVNLQIFPTQDGRGWGVRSTDDIKRGQYVGNYVGELITSVEARRRRHAGNSITHKDVYLFALDKFSDIGSTDPRLAGEPYEIDGEFFSGPTRFINHSCDPNLRIFAVVTDSANTPFHGLAFFALKDIDKDTELTFDYTDGVNKKDDRPLRQLSKEERAGLTKCLCGSPKCRGYLW
ncbi:SET domain protein [Cadophora sp. MPI-SDFR-AT-0126]|nr:SET domain protein [Leotiomycetes sp. MPI-SDFR-AT-0126]